MEEMEFLCGSQQDLSVASDVILTHFLVFFATCSFSVIVLEALYTVADSILCRIPFSRSSCTPSSETKALGPTEVK